MGLSVKNSYEEFAMSAADSAHRAACIAESDTAK